MNASSTVTRETKYCHAIRTQIQIMGHATNKSLLEALRKEFPSLSATTVHRATARLCERGELMIAPPDIDGAMRYDANTEPHDHLACYVCGCLTDIDIRDKVAPIIKQEVADCVLDGTMTISGRCANCTIKTKLKQNHN